MGGWWRKLLGDRSSSPSSSASSERAGRARGEFAHWGGCTSFHLWWGPLPAGPVVELSAVLEVLEEPTVEPTYFWALQGTFADARGTHGAAHLGLQWYGRFADHRAANWGGYANPPASDVLRGTPPALPGFADDPNTRAYPWRAGVPYRLRIFRGEQGWAGSVTDTQTGEEVVLRELLAGGDRLEGAVVWAEIFAPCTASQTLVRWTELTAVLATGEVVHPERVRVTMPNHGACPNTDVVHDGTGLCQITATSRSTHDGAVIRT